MSALCKPLLMCIYKYYCFKISEPGGRQDWKLLYVPNLILKLYVFHVQIISLVTGKILPGVAGETKRQQI
jgi:hypothetical protein